MLQTYLTFFLPNLELAISPRSPGRFLLRDWYLENKIWVLGILVTIQVCLQTPWGYYPCPGFHSHHTALLLCMNVLLAWLITYWRKEKGNEASPYRLQVLTDLEEVGSVPAWKWAIYTHRNHLPLSRCNLDPAGTTQRKAVDLDVLGNCIEALPGEYPTPKTKSHTRE